MALIKRQLPNPLNPVTFDFIAFGMCCCLIHKGFITSPHRSLVSSLLYFVNKDWVHLSVVVVSRLQYNFSKRRGDHFF